jgi:hypothetical protein
MVLRGTLYISDLHRTFANNPSGLTEFLSVAIAASLSHSELENLDEWSKLSVSLLKLVSRPGSVPEASPSKIIPTLPAGIGTHLRALFESRRISQQSLKKLAERLGFEVAGTPGRAPRDYALEYVWKASGLSWTRVATRALLEDSEFREEFGGREFIVLDLREQEALKHRIREGVKSYAMRAGKPLPPKLNDGSEAADREQKNPKIPAGQETPPDKLPS